MANGCNCEKHFHDPNCTRPEHSAEASLESRVQSPAFYEEQLRLLLEERDAADKLASELHIRLAHTMSNYDREVDALRVRVQQLEEALRQIATETTTAIGGVRDYMAVPTKAAEIALAALAAGSPGKRSLVDELLEERRQEAQDD